MAKAKRKTAHRLDARRKAAKSGQGFRVPGSQNRNKSFPGKKFR